MPEGKLTVAVIDPSRARAAIVEEGLRASGVDHVVVILETGGLLERLARIDPDVIVIDLENPSRDLLEQMFHISRLVERPVAMFEAGAPLAAAERAGLLAGRTAQGGDASPIVCSCHGVRRARIEVAIEGGARTLDAICAACAAGTNCGSCRPEIKGILHAHQRLPAVIEAA